VVAAEHERQRALLERQLHEPGHTAARRLDLGQVTRSLVRLVGGLLHGRLDVAPVHTAVADPGQPVVQARVPNRRRTHVDAASAGAEIEGRADDRDLLASSHAQNLLATIVQPEAR